MDKLELRSRRDRTSNLRLYLHAKTNKGTLNYKELLALVAPESDARSARLASCTPRKG
jgi:hypothetical protein